MTIAAVQIEVPNVESVTITEDTLSVDSGGGHQRRGIIGWKAIGREPSNRSSPGGMIK